MKKALITGVTGQDGSYLAELLLDKGYEVHGIRRRTSLFNTDRIDHLYQDPHLPDTRLFLHYGDLTDTTCLVRIIQLVQPDEIYNLAAQSHVAVSFEEPEYTANSDALGALRILEAIRLLGLENKTRFYQASTSELYGLVQEIPQKETVAVGMAVASHPPHRSVRAELPHTAPAKSSGLKSLFWMRMQHFKWRKKAICELAKTTPWHIIPLTPS